MEEFDTPGSSEKTTAILGGRWWPKAAKQEGDEISKIRSSCNLWKRRHDRRNVGGVPTRSRSGAPSVSKGSNGTTAEASNTGNGITTVS